MIIDRIGNWRKYFTDEKLVTAFKFLESIHDGIEDGERKLDGDKVFALIKSYKTLERAATMLEAHREYIDIQVVIQGMEILDWYPREGLEVLRPYNPDRDVEKLKTPAGGGSALTLVPGLFALFHPWDAHAPGISLETCPMKVRKVVVKVKC